MSVRSLVIVAVDGSQQTERTVEYAVSLASTRGAELHGVQVVPRDGALWIAPENETRLRARLRALRSLADSEAVSFRIVTLRGKPESAASEESSVFPVGMRPARLRSPTKS